MKKWMTLTLALMMAVCCLSAGGSKKAALTVKVIDIEKGSGKIRLSRKAALDELDK